jgi:hypothetical protein
MHRLCDHGRLLGCQSRMPRDARATAPVSGMAGSVSSRCCVPVVTTSRPTDYSSQFSAWRARPPQRFAMPLAAEHGAVFPRTNSGRNPDPGSGARNGSCRTKPMTKAGQWGASVMPIGRRGACRGKGRRGRRGGAQARPANPPPREGGRVARVVCKSGQRAADLTWPLSATMQATARATTQATTQHRCRRLRRGGCDTGRRCLPSSDRATR